MKDGFILAVDVEATCDEGNAIARQEMEIIEIGAVLLNNRLETVGEYQTFIKPYKNPVLTPFCKELTHITQQDVDTAPSVHEAFNQLGSWLQDFQPLTWCSWGDYDYKQFKVDCARSGASWPFSGEHFNAKKTYAERMKKKKQGLFLTVEELGLEWIGTHHRGIDDARNVAQILKQVL